jgi:hypothetical protein
VKINHKLVDFLGCFLCAFVSCAIVSAFHLTAVPAAFLTVTLVGLGLAVVSAARRATSNKLTENPSRGLITEKKPSRATAPQPKPATGSGATAASARVPKPESESSASTWRKDGKSIKLESAKDGTIRVTADGLSNQQFNGGHTYKLGLRSQLESVSGIKWTQNTREGKRLRVMAGTIAPGSDQLSVIAELKKAIGACTL